jgi:hypothetical protein
VGSICFGQFDLLLTGQDFPVLPGNTQFLLPCQENNHKKILFIGVEK